MTRRNLCILAIALCCACSSAAQPETERLTNDNVVAMVKAGRPTDEIVQRIKKSQSTLVMPPNVVEVLLDDGVQLKVLRAMVDRVPDANRGTAPDQTSAQEDAAALKADADALRERCPNGKKLFFAFVDPETGGVSENYLSTEELKGFLHASSIWTKASRPYCSAQYVQNADLVVLHTHTVGRHVYLRAALKDANPVAAAKRRRNQDKEMPVNFDLGQWNAFLQIATGEVEASDNSAYVLVLDPKGHEMPYENGRNTFMVGIHGWPENRCIRETLEHLRRTRGK